MGVVVSKGFLVVAQNTDSDDFVRQAYLLALSIKFSQHDVKNISIITNDRVSGKYKKVFDNIIPIPFGDQSNNSRFRAENRWKVYHATPYDETIVLDTDMIFTEDVSAWWDYCSNYDIKFCSRIKNYKLETIVEDSVHRKTFLANSLPNPYYALHYFKKSDSSHEFYKTLEFVCNNWEWCWGKFAPEEYQNWLSMDLATAVTIEMLGLNETAIDVCSPLEFVHMKSAVQGWPMIPDKWTDAVPCVLNSKGDFIIGNIKQSKLFHYVEKHFANDYIEARLEDLVYGKK